MKRINLRDYYPSIHTHDYFIDVSDEVAAALDDFKRAEDNYHLRVRRHKAYYSLDAGDGIERAALYPPPTPEDVYEREQDDQLLFEALDRLTKTQRRRLTAYFFGEKSYAEIARDEGVSERSVRESIEQGLWHMENFLKKVF